MSRRDELKDAIEQTQNLINAPTCYPPLKEIAQKWIDSIDTPEECETACAFILELKADIRPIDNLIEFATSDDAKKCSAKNLRRRWRSMQSILKLTAENSAIARRALLREKF